ETSTIQSGSGRMSPEQRLWRWPVGPTPNGVQRFRREPRSAGNACSRARSGRATAPRASWSGGGRSASQFTLRGAAEMETEGTLSSAWDRHLASEFDAKSADQALATMTADPHVNLVPLMIGARGRSELRDFYANHFLNQIPPDVEMVTV